MAIRDAVIAVDFDGTVVTHEYPHVGRDAGAVPVLRELTDNGCRLILYTMRSGGSSHPKSWRITGSNDGQEWTELHAVSDCKTLNGPRKTETFVLDAPTAEYRMIRYVQTDNQSPRAERKYRINLKAIEFFGTLSE